MPRHAVLSWWPLKAALGRGERRLPPDIKQREWRAQADLFRDVFANPFRPVAFNPARHGDVMSRRGGRAQENARQEVG
jgi:hypothetical protein